jgi:hypothetical protein
MDRRQLLQGTTAALTTSSNALAQGEPAERFKFQDRDGELDIVLGGKPVATYLYRHAEITRPGFINLRTSDGIQVTRNFPPRVPEDQTPGFTQDGGVDHRLFHLGLWMSFGDLDGEDYWRLKSRTEHVRFIEQRGGSPGTLQIENRYLRANGKDEVCRERLRCTFSIRPDGWAMRWRSVFTSKDADFYFGDQDEMGLGVRMASPLRVKGGNGTITTDRGATNEPEAWGKPFSWIDYSGTVGGRHVGVTVAPSGTNPRESWAHCRDYGVMVLNPFSRNPKDNAREPATKTMVNRGESLSLTYSVFVHSAFPDKDHGPAQRANLTGEKP